MVDLPQGKGEKIMYKANSLFLSKQPKIQTLILHWQELSSTASSMEIMVDWGKVVSKQQSYNMEKGRIGLSI